MKQQLKGNDLSFQEALVAAIHGAFEVAVDIAVREVKQLAGQASSDIYAELRRENDSLKERLRRAEAALGDRRDTARNHNLGGTKSAQQPHPECTQANIMYPKVDSVHSCSGVSAGGPSLTDGVFQASDPQDGLMSPGEEPGSIQDNDGPAHCKTDLNDECVYNEVTEQLSQACVVKAESLNTSCNKPGDQAAESLSLRNKLSTDQVMVKQEHLEEMIEASSCCMDTIKMEEFGLEECLSEVQSKMLEQWKPVVSDSQSQDINFQLDQVDSPIETTSICPDADQLSSEFPNTFQAAEPATSSEAPPQVYGVYVRTSRPHNHSLHTCKSCGQSFHLPSLLRRHNGQCQQRLQQRYQQPVSGGKRTRLQLFPPGCSPYRCTVCNREFNRLENLKTHLRIHTGERPYTCSVCSKCFRHSGALTRHFRIHTGEKPYVCGQCGKSFRNCGGLKFHQRSHNGQL